MIKSKNTTIHAFLKFGEEENMKSLYEEGIIFLNPIEYFRKYEDNGLRGDKYEGISEIKNLPSGTFEIKEFNHIGKYESLQIRRSFDQVVGNIYSLYCISSKGFPNYKKFEISKKVLEFGTHTILFKNLPLFLKKIRNAFISLNIEFKEGFVHYYDKNKINEEIDLFQKPNEFEYQKEFRFYAIRDSIEPLILILGNLEGICEIHKTSDLIARIGMNKKREITWIY